MKKSSLTWMLVATLAVSGLAACGDDDESSESETTEAVAPVTEADGGDTDTTEAGGGESSGNADVAAYCEEARALAAELKDVMSDPTSGDMAALSAQATELVNAAAQLSSASPDDVDEINACSAEITSSMGG